MVAGFAVHDSKFLGTYLKDMIMEQTIREEYPNVTIVESELFYQIENTYEVARRMTLTYPEVKRLYVSWEDSALGAVRVIRELNRCDIKTVTLDPDYEIARTLANEDIILELNTQKVYDQGITAGQATVKTLLSRRGYEYISTSPCIVKRQNLLSVWREVMHENAPDEPAKISKNELLKKQSSSAKNRISVHRHPPYPD